MAIQSYKDLVVWKKGMDLVDDIYDLTSMFPKEERYGLSSQMQKAAVSIPSNIAEGYRRGTRADYRHFLLNSFGSGAELETQIEITKRRTFGKNLDFRHADQLLLEMMKMLNAMIEKLKD